MRISLRRAVQWVVALVLLQAVVYYWSVSFRKGDKSQRKIWNAPAHPYLKPRVGNEAVCTFRNCPETKEGHLNVHLIPHSHIDVGWLKTVDQYYEGVMEGRLGQERLYLVDACVKCTLDKVLEQLKLQPHRRFIFAEMKYFSRFWNEASEEKKQLIKTFIAERRLELINGGWVMSDAAVTLYKDIIDQHTLGFDFIREAFGPCAQTQTAWHVDQFGHTQQHGTIFAEMGYNALVIGRIDYQDHDRRKLTKELEFIWNTSPNNLGPKSWLFTHVTYDGYYAPPNYVFENQGQNVVKNNEVRRYADIMEDRSNCFQTDHLMVPMGSDFGYQEAEVWFRNMDILMQDINRKYSHKDGRPLNLIYSTPSCYFHAVNAANKTYTQKKDDFHPYGIDPGVYWTGYFTTRPGLKLHTWRAGQILQSCKQLSIFNNLEDTFDNVNALRDIVAVMQHHDAITGTQQLHVMRDYNLLLSAGEKQCEAVMGKAYRQMWSDLPIVDKPHFCPDLNISQCNTSTHSGNFMMTLYNPLGWPVTTQLHLPAGMTGMTIKDSKGYDVPFQLLPVPLGVATIPERSSKAEINVLVPILVPPLSTKSFVVHADKKGEVPQFEVAKGNGADIIIENEHLALTFHGQTGLLETMSNKKSNVRHSLSQDFLYYKGLESGIKSSGAYLFIPASETPSRTDGSQSNVPTMVETRVIRGHLVEEVHQKFSSWVSQVVRLYKGAPYAEFEWVVGPIPDGDGKEVISRFTSELKSGDKFYTDSNGREISERIRKKVLQPQQSDEFVVGAKDVASSYYPVTNKIFIQDKARDIQLTILPDRPQGGSSLSSGHLELMVHRRLRFDDSLGVGEPLMDKGADGKGIIFKGRHWVCLDTIKKSAEITKHLGFQLQLEPTVMFTDLNNQNVRTWKENSFMQSSLPLNVHILTLDRVTKNDTTLLLLRLEHVFGKKEHPILSEPATVYLEHLFSNFDIITAEETSLGGNFNPKDVHRMRWNSEKVGLTPEYIGSEAFTNEMKSPFPILLQPMEIRTFRIQIMRF